MVTSIEGLLTLNKEMQSSLQSESTARRGDIQRERELRANELVNIQAQIDTIISGVAERKKWDEARAEGAASVKVRIPVMQIIAIIGGSAGAALAVASMLQSIGFGG